MSARRNATEHARVRNVREGHWEAAEGARARRSHCSAAFEHRFVFARGILLVTRPWRLRRKTLSTACKNCVNGLTLGPKCSPGNHTPVPAPRGGLARFVFFFLAGFFWRTFFGRHLWRTFSGGLLRRKKSAKKVCQKKSAKKSLQKKNRASPPLGAGTGV